ncbi:hypothetical protein [Pseudomonas baetica]|uniref:hypothetical protein n=1 Tax=Pseudomonas baetica TaxID=674054 RepID=UPI001FC93664|nr:hypothetical protein [Pseudomonas baetica]
MLSEGFKRAGSTFSQLAPQDFYLSLVGDRFGGRCYPLVRAMAVALADAGSKGINSLVQNFPGGRGAASRKFDVAQEESGQAAFQW